VATAAVADEAVVRGTVFYKMSGSGNDFVVLDGRATTADQWPASRIQSICDRRRGVGADGLVIVAPATDEAVRMTYWNSDGSRTAMCGNAALCSGRLAVHLELVPPGEFCLLTDAGPVRVRARSAVETAEINLPDVEILEDDFTAVAPSTGERWMSFVSVGVPHLVVRVDDVELVEIGTRGKALRFEAALGPEGANVNFISPTGRDTDLWLIRTYERGVEGETLACGTGTVAAALALAARGEAKLPLRFRSRGGPELSVQAELSGKGATNVWLAGPGQLVFRGVWEAA
jgi:diaminopimelate epimerase